MPFIFLLCTTSSHRWRADVLHKSRTAWIFIGYGRGGAKKTIDPEWNPWGRNRIANFQFLLEAVDVPFVLVARRSTQAGSRQILIAVENFTYASRSIITTQMRSRNPGLGSILNEYALDSWHALRWFSPSSSSVTFSLLLIYFYWIMVVGQCRIDWILFLNLPFFITRDTCSVFRFLRKKKKKKIVKVSWIRVIRLINEAWPIILMNWWLTYYLVAEFYCTTINRLVNLLPSRKKIYYDL